MMTITILTNFKGAKIDFAKCLFLSLKQLSNTLLTN